MRRILLAIALISTASCSSSNANTTAAPACKPAALPSPLAESPDLALARQVADTFMANHPAESLSWDWSEGLAVASIVDLYRATGQTSYRDWASRYYAWWDTHGYNVLASDRCAPAMGAATLHATSCDPGQEKEVQAVLDYLDHVAIRDDKGGISHLGGSTLFPPTVWIDSMMMYGEVLIRWGESAGDAKSLDLYASQFRITTAELQDPGGFYTHASNWPGQTPGVFWARGNSWVLVSGTDYLRVRKARGEAMDEGVAGPLRKLAAAIVATQDASGLWWDIPSRPGEIYLETSASALFALGLARGYRAGAFDASVVPVVKEAMDAVKTKIVNGVVTGIKGPTDAGSFDNYARVPLANDVPLGVGGVIFALIETSGL